MLIERDRRINNNATVREFLANFNFKTLKDFYKDLFEEASKAIRDPVKEDIGELKRKCANLERRYGINNKVVFGDNS